MMIQNMKRRHWRARQDRPITRALYLFGKRLVIILTLVFAIHPVSLFADELQDSKFQSAESQNVEFQNIEFQNIEFQSGRLQNSEIDKALLKVRYSTQDKIASFKSGGESSNDFNDFSTSLDDDSENSSLPGRKSVFKAGILSLLVPGLGQVYNGSHIGKVALFAGTEVGTLLGAKKYNNDGDKTVAKFQAMARANWNEDDYWDYLLQVYNDTTDADDDLGAVHGHHLPKTQTQQYFEMIGKYDQFSYGWARAEGHGADSGQIADTAFVWSSSDTYGLFNRFPSPKRIAYNALRGDANRSFDKRDQMIIYTILNHVVSSVDAIISASRHNRKIDGARSSLSFHPSLRRDENWALIPEVKVSLKF